MAPAGKVSEADVSSWLLLFGLGVAWAVVLVPDFIRRNAASRRSDTIGQFARNLSSLERSAPVGVHRPASSFQHHNVVQFPGGRALTGPVAPLGEPTIDLRDGAPRRVTPAAGPAARTRRPSAAKQRRKDILTALVAAAVLTFLGSVSLGGALVMVNAVVDVALVAYLGALALVSRKERMRAQVGVLYTAQFRGVAPAYADRRTAVR